MTEFTRKVEDQAVKDRESLYASVIHRTLSGPEGAITFRMFYYSEEGREPFPTGVWSHTKERLSENDYYSEKCDVLEGEGGCYSQGGYMAGEWAGKAFLEDEEKGWAELETAYREFILNENQETDA